MTDTDTTEADAEALAPSPTPRQRAIEAWHDQEKRARTIGFTDQLHALAHALAFAHAERDLPDDAMSSWYKGVTIHFYADDLAHAARLRRQIGGTFHKEETDVSLTLVRFFGPHRVEISIARDNAACERVVTGTEIRTVTKYVPVEVQETVELVEWKCPPVGEWDAPEPEADSHLETSYEDSQGGEADAL